MSGRQKKSNPAQEAFRQGCALVNANPVLGPLMQKASEHFDDSYPMAKEDWESTVVSIVGLVIALTIAVTMIGDLFALVREIFGVY